MSTPDREADACACQYCTTGIPIRPRLRVVANPLASGQAAERQAFAVCAPELAEPVRTMDMKFLDCLDRLFDVLG